MTQEEVDKKNENPGEYLPDVKDELSKVAINPKQNFIIIIGIVIIGAFLIFNLFFSGKSQEVKKIVEVPKNITKISDPATDSNIAAPQLPSLPAITPPVPLPPHQLDNIQAPPIALPTVLPEKVTETSDQKQQRLTQKNKAAIFSIGTPTASKPSSDPKETIKFDSISDKTDYLIYSGKIIDAILETAINSDTGAPQVRAILSRDVYGESGNTVLIPKGSRILGSYSPSASNGRVEIVWNRIYYSSGHVLNLEAQLTDNLGRLGAEGRYDPKNKEKFTNVVMTSAFSVLAAKGIDILIPPADGVAAKNAAAAQASQIRSSAFNFAQANPNPADLVAAKVIVGQICSMLQTSITDITSPAYSSGVSQCQALLMTTSITDPKIFVSSAVYIANSTADLLISSAQNTQSNVQKAATEAYNNVTKSVTDMFANKLSPTVTIPQGRAIKIQVMQNYFFPLEFTNKVNLNR
jgi:type IV secretion system protein VirB10